MNLLNTVLLIAYPILCIIDITNNYAGRRRISKMLLMPELCAYFITGCLARSCGLRELPWLLVVGIICGFLGDTFLLNEKMLAPGLGSFLVGHIFYILQFSRGIIEAGGTLSTGMSAYLAPLAAIQSDADSSVALSTAAVSSGTLSSGIFLSGTVRTALILLILVIYTAIIALVLRKLFPSIQGAMKAAAAVYMIAIFAMSFTAFLRIGTVPAASFLCTWIGSILFIISDSILAVQLFAGGKGRGVMETYCTAQFLIAEGILLAL